MRNIAVVTPLGRRHDGYLRELAQNIHDYASGYPVRAHWVIALDTRDVTCEQVLSIARSAAPASLTVVPAPPLSEGPGTARTRALSEVTADWLLTIDSDDTFNPAGVEALLSAADEEGLTWAAGQSWDVDAQGAFLSTGPETPSERQRIACGAFFAHRVEHGRPPFHPSATVVRSEVVRAAGGWPRGWTRTEDSALWSVINAQHEGVWVPTHVLNYRKHGESVTASPSYTGSADHLMPLIADFIRCGSTNPQN